MPTEDLAMRDMEACIYTIAISRRLASEYRQLGLKRLSEHLKDNARAAEKWLVKAGRSYPLRCDSKGKPVQPGAI